MLDLLSSGKPTDGFTQFAGFCSVLNTDYKWLSRDLVVDLRVERGEVQPDTQTFDEAAVFVHR